MDREHIVFLGMLLLPLFVQAQQESEVKIVELVATSSMPDYGKHHYGPAMAFDGDPLTAWVEGKKESGIGESIEIKLAKRITIDSVAVMPGYFDPPYHKTNNRVKELKMKSPEAFFNGGRAAIEISLPFRDAMERQVIRLKSPVTIEELSFTIADVYEGRDPDTCIAEIELYNKGRRIALRVGNTEDKPQTFFGTKYFQVGTHSKAEEGALRKQFMTFSGGLPDIILYREAFDLSLLREISSKQYESESKSGSFSCGYDCMLLKFTTYESGYIRSITTTVNHGASTGIVNEIYTFDQDGLLSAMEIDAWAYNSKPILVERMEKNQIVITQKVVYYQTTAGTEVTTRHIIDYNDRYEITNHIRESKERELTRQ